MHAPESRCYPLPGRASWLAAALLLPLLAGCSSWGFPGVYRINVEQGNIVTLEMLEQLETGMSRRQVRYILGTPLVEDPFNPDRWEYLYMVRNGEDTLVDQRLTVFFEGDMLVDYTSNQPLPGREEEAGAEAASAAAAEPEATDG